MEALAADVPVVPKDAATTALIVHAVRPNPLFAGLPESVTLALVASMSRVFVPAGENIITQGDVEGANRFFVLESGSAVVRVAPERTQGAAPRDDDVRAAAAESENETPPSRDDATKRPSSRTLSSDSDPDPSGELVGSCRAGTPSASSPSCTRAPGRRRSEPRSTARSGRWSARTTWR